MVAHIFYDPLVDLSPVDQFGFVDLVSAMTDGVVDPSNNSDNLDFDGDVESADFVGRKVMNPFDAIDNQQKLADGVKANKSE